MKKSVRSILLIIGLSITALLFTAVVGYIAWANTVFDCGPTPVAEIMVNETLNAPLLAYKLNNGDYPTTQEGLHALVECPPGKEEAWKGPYIEREVIDPWGHPYQYRYPGIHNKDGYDIWSLGEDGVISDDDARNW